MRTFSVTEALIYLNELIPGLAPKNEETLRRAIRNGELKAEQRLGRGGNKISESDLIEYSKKYISKSFLKDSKDNLKAALMNFLPADMLPFQEVMLTDVLKHHIDSKGENNLQLKIQLLEARKRWEKKRNLILLKIQSLENELSICNNEITAFDREIDKY
jgi:hypothetical protein